MHEDGIDAGTDVMAVPIVVRRGGGDYRCLRALLAASVAAHRTEYGVYVQRNDPYLHDAHCRFAFWRSYHDTQYSGVGDYNNRNNPIGTLMKYAFIALAVVFAASCAQMLLKQGARKGYTPWWKQYINGWVISGYALMFAAMMANIGCMHQGLQLKDLSIIESMSYFFVPVLSWLFFRESISKRKALAIGIIIIGVIVFFL